MNPNLQQAEMKRDVEGGTASGIMVGKNFPDVLDAIRLIKASILGLHRINKPCNYGLRIISNLILHQH
jgi:hypothetical protein